MSDRAKNFLVEGFNTFCYAVVAVACCAVITFSWVLISAASVINMI